MTPAIGASCPSSPGSFYRHTKTAYVGGSYADPSVNLVGLPSVVSVDQGGAVAAKTLYGDDETDATRWWTSTSTTTGCR